MRSVKWSGENVGLSFVRVFICFHIFNNNQHENMKGVVERSSVFDSKILTTTSPVPEDPLK